MNKVMTMAVLIITISIIPFPPLHPEDDATVLYRQGMEQYEKKNYKSAYDLFRKALKANPFNEQASNMYWKMKAEHSIQDLTDGVEGKLKDTKKDPVPDRNGKKNTGPDRPKKKETPHRDGRAEREAAAALKELRGKITALNERIDTREREIALLEKRHKQKVAAEQENSRMMLRIVTVVIIVLLAISLGMLIFAFATVSRREKRPSGTLLAEAPVAGQEASARGQSAGGHQVPYPFQGRQEAWNAATGALSTQRYAMDIGRPKDDTLALSASEFFSKMEVTIAGFVRLIEHRLNRDNNDFRVRKLCHDIGKKLGLTSVEMMELRTAALMKDIGFLLIPEALLLKQKALTKQEREIVQKHVGHSLKIAQYSPQPPRILEAVEKHHERMDGSGYPYGIKGDSIPLFSRIIGICDTFTALTSDRPYRAALDNDTALSVMERESRLFDPDILTVLFELFGQEVVRSQKPGEYLFDKDLYPEETLGSQK